MAAPRNNRKRRRGRGRFGPLLKLLCVLAVVVALTVGATVFFQVETVVVSGNNRYTTQEVVDATGIQVGDNLFRMNKYQIDRQVRQKLPYVGELAIRRGLPSSIIITLAELDAVARIEISDTGLPAAPDVTAAAEDEPDSSAGETSSAEPPLEIAYEPWLISVGGKLLEPAYPDNTAISVSGITLLMPRAGTMLALPQEEQARGDGLLSLLAALEELELMAHVSSVKLGTTRIEMGYLDRFTVILPLNGNFNYQLRVLEEAVLDLNNRVGETCTGTLDLTQENYPAVYSPD